MVSLFVRPSSKNPSYLAVMLIPGSSAFKVSVPKRGNSTCLHPPPSTATFGTFFGGGGTCFLQVPAPTSCSDHRSELWWYPAPPLSPRSLLGHTQVPENCGTIQKVQRNSHMCSRKPAVKLEGFTASFPYLRCLVPALKAKWRIGLGVDIAGSLKR